MKKLLLASLTAAAMVGANAPASALDQVAFRSKIDAITSKYEPKLEALERQADALDDDMPSKEELLFDIELDEMSEVRFSMHVPEITMDRWEYSMHIPEVTMKLRRFSWHVPEMTMKIRDLGFGIKTKIPEWTMRRKEWATEVPEVTMRHRKFSMDIPEVTMKQRDFSFHVPKISVGGPRDHVDTMKSDGDAIQAEASKLAEQMQAEISGETHAFLLASRAEAEKQFHFAISTFDAGIRSAPNAEVKADLEVQRSKVLQQRTQVLSEIDTQLNKLS